MRILMVLTSHDKLGGTGEKTGFWLEEFAAPYYTFKDAGAQITLASPAGGQPPLDPKSDEPEYQTRATVRFNEDSASKAELANTLKLSEVQAEDFYAVFYPGGHGPLWDLAEDAHSIGLIENMIDAGKYVGAVCHATAVLRNVRQPDGTLFVNGRSITGFSNAEEEAVGLTKIVPFLLEDDLRARGANFSTGPDWSVHVVDDGHLITGQNPASSEKAAEILLEKLGAA
ncbi:type 1 glutamine amidotransferase domain-containing protein [Biformimicrobium ophioploci]|uniref:Type 1 glutamine amidotransferase domain-containing protein n=1 Tax=Biformimicrobium ophioploci TaxID=3036711 RepID=A0ABQ6LYA6_9GAMM|nr:type 1 glutamine amidotransferase domain-containing protein [Microbulbifer sp. NKW57]GMG87070.1 type 1 glutamine amidotransferase domain-containing protein [Microbulbifer sp. NKW57]